VNLAGDHADRFHNGVYFFVSHSVLYTDLDEFNISLSTYRKRDLLITVDAINESRAIISNHAKFHPASRANVNNEIKFTIQIPSEDPRNNVHRIDVHILEGTFYYRNGKHILDKGKFSSETLFYTYLVRTGYRNNFLHFVVLQFDIYF